MESKKIIELIDSIEEQIELSAFKINDVDMWPHIRMQLMISLSPSETEENVGKYKYLQRVFSKLRLIPTMLMNSIIQNLKYARNTDSKLSSTDILCLTDTSSKRIMMNDQWYDVFMDPILDYYEPKAYKWAIIETAQRGLFKTPLYRSTKSISLALIYNYLKSIFLIKSIPANDVFDRSYEMYSIVMEQNGLSGYVANRGNLYLEASYISQLSKYFLKMLKRMTPKIVFMAPYNGYAGRALCHACNTLSITTVDIQHGVQGEHHHAYSYRKVPSQGFNVLPNIYLTWSDTESSNINKTFKKVSNSRAITIGNMMLNKFMHNSDINTYYIKKIEGVFPKNNGVQYILITLQWGQAFSSIFLDLLKTSPKNYFYLIRLHPSSTLQEKKMILNTLAKENLNNFETHFSSLLPIYSLLGFCLLHITRSSSVVLEASRFNVKSIVTDLSGKALYENEIEHGETFWCDDDQKIIEKIRVLEDSIVEKQKVPSAPPDYDVLERIINMSIVH